MRADPICRHIERSRRLWAEYVAVCHSAEPKLGTAEHAQWEDEQERTRNLWAEAFKRMVATTPRTVAGAVALIGRFLATESDVLAREHDAILAILRTLRRFLKRL